MKISMPKGRYDSAKIERDLNNIIKNLEKKIDDSKIFDDITTSGSEPPSVREKQPFMRSDGTTKELIVRHEGQTYKLTFTKV